MQLQQAVKQAPPQAATPQAAQQLGASSAGQAGQQATQQAGNLQEQTGQIAGLGVQAQQQASQAKLADLEAGGQQEMLTGRERLANLSEEAANTMLDSRLQFAKDEMGRTFLNERQLADYAVMHAESKEALQNYSQKAQQLHKYDMMFMESAHKTIVEALSQEHKLREMGFDQDAIREMKQAAHDLQISIQKKQAAAAERLAQGQLAGGIIGAVVGTYYGGPMGGAAGQKMGSGIGTVAAS
jgi:hypothetical protein